MDKNKDKSSVDLLAEHFAEGLIKTFEDKNFVGYCGWCHRELYKKDISRNKPYEEDGIIVLPEPECIHCGQNPYKGCLIEGGK